MDVAKVDRDTFIAQAGDDPRAQKEAALIFNNFHIQRSFSRNKETGRPDWFDFTVESVGTTPAKDLVKKAVEILQAKMEEFVKSPILREADGWYRVELPGETYTIGQLAQEMIYMEKLAEFVSADIGHPLVPKLTVRFNNTTDGPDAVLSKLKEKASALCENVLRSV
jgi:DNA-directed RNA polymerase subunit L